jgi:hypothetical protein
MHFIRLLMVRWISWLHGQVIAAMKGKTFIVAASRIVLMIGFPLIYSPSIKGASFLINAYCCLDSVAVVANNPLIRFEHFRKGAGNQAKN